MAVPSLPDFMNTTARNGRGGVRCLRADPRPPLVLSQRRHRCVSLKCVRRRSCGVYSEVIVVVRWRATVGVIVSLLPPGLPGTDDDTGGRHPRRRRTVSFAALTMRPHRPSDRGRHLGLSPPRLPGSRDGRAAPDVGVLLSRDCARLDRGISGADRAEAASSATCVQDTRVQDGGRMRAPSGRRRPLDDGRICLLPD
jgi:hypothetical protein